MLREYFENSSQHVKISECVYICIYLKALNYGLHMLFLKINYETMLT